MLLSVPASNPLWFVNGDGDRKVLTGGYFGCELQDNCFNSTIQSNWTSVMADLTNNNGNLVRMWTSETGGSTNVVSPMPWNRHASTCCAADGLNKFNLASLNVGNLTTPQINSTAYFERMKARVANAKAGGKYVSIMLFHSFGWENASARCPSCTSWTRHPFNSANNTNGVNGDTNADGLGIEIAAVGGPGESFQQAYIDQVVDTVEDYDNVLFEICNECYDTADMNAWQQRVIDRIQAREAGNAIQHPIGITSLTSFPGPGCGSNSVLTASDANWYAPCGSSYSLTPAANTGGKPSILDTDHITGECCVDNDWPGKSFARGHNLWLLYEQAGASNGSPTAAGQTLLTRMGQVATYASRMGNGLATAVPDTTAASCSTTYCLKGSDDVFAYLPSGGSITLTVPPGTWNAEWMNVTSSAITTVGSVAGGPGTFVSPHGATDAIFYLHRTGTDTIPPSQVTGVSVTNLQASNLTLNWTAATDNIGVQNYDIERCTGSGCSNFAVISTVTGTSSIVMGLTAGTTYSFRMKARDLSGNVSVSYSATVTATTLILNLPSIVSVDADATGADVTWSGSPSAVRVITDTLNIVEPISVFGGGMQSIAHVQSRATTGSGTSAVLSYTSDNTVGNLLALRLKAPAGITISTVTDTRGNTWTAIPSATGGTQGYQALRYAANCAAGSNTVTVALSGSAASFELDIVEYSGADQVTPLTQSKFAEQADPGTGANAITTGSITTANDGELILGGAMYAGATGGATVTSGTGYTLRQNATGHSPVEDKILATAGSTAATFTTNVVGGGVTLADIALVQSTAPQSGTGLTQIVKSYTSNVTAGSLLVMLVEFGSSKTITGVSGCGTWAEGRTQVAGTERISLWYALNVAGGACTVTTTFSAALNFGSLVLAEYSGVAASSALDVSASQTQLTPGTSSNGITSGAATTTSDKDLIIGMTMAYEGLGNAISAGTSFTCRQKFFTSACANAADSMYEDRILATAGSVAATFTGTNANENMVSLMVAFKPAAIGATEWFLSSVASFKPASVLGSRYDRIWPSGTTFVCFRAIDSLGNENPNQVCDAVATGADTTAPVRSNASPTGTLASGTTETLIALQTDEPANCRYDTSAGTAYGSMTELLNASLSLLSHSATVTGLSDGNTFDYYVRCQDIAGNPNVTDTHITFDVEAAPSDVDPPSQVLGLTGSILSPTQVQLSWTAATDDTAVTSYQIFISSNGGVVFTLVGTSATTTFNVLGLAPNLTYQFQVRALDAVGNQGDFSDAVSLTTSASDTTPPDTLIGMTATQIDFQTLELNWTEGVDNLEVTDTNIEQCEGASCTGFELIAVVTNNGTTLRVAGLRPQTSYRFRGKHVDAAGNASTAYSTPITGITPPVPAGTVMGICPCEHVR